MKSFGDGARGEVYVKWANDANAHVFVAENRNGEVYFFDPQSGELDVEHYFDEVADGATKLARIDNLEMNNKYLQECCEGGSTTLTLKEAVQIVKKYIPADEVLREPCGEIPTKYVFLTQRLDGRVATGGGYWTVDKKTSECKYEHLERESLKPYAKIVGYKKLELPD